MTWTEVASDAVKIGLGAIIGGVFALLASRMAHQQKLTEEYSRRRRDILEKLAERFDYIAQVGIQRAAHLSALCSVKPLKTREEIAKMVAEAEGGKDSTMDYLIELHSIEAKLALLAFSHISEVLEEYRMLFTSLDPAVVPKTKEAEGYAVLETALHARRTIIVTLMAQAFKEA